jgi:tRNA(fMet)-specific endonuclease VapC
MRFGATGPKISPRHVQLVDEFCARIDVVLPWPAPRWTLPQILRSGPALAGTPIGPNDTVIVGHTIAVLAMNTREFERITGIKTRRLVK